MDTAQISALVAVITALPLNGILLFIIIILYRRNEKLTDELIICTGKRDYPTELVVDAQTTEKGAAPKPPVKRN